MNVAAVLAAIDISAGTAVRFAAGTAFQSILAAVARDGAAVGKGQRFLQRHVDALAGTGFSRVPDSCKRQHRRHRAGHLVGEMARCSALPFGVVALAEQKSTGGIGNGVAAFVMPIRTRAAERRDRHDDQTRELIAEALIGEARFFQIAERRRFDDELCRN